MINKEQMIYIHIPFCTKRCFYCNFVSFCSTEIQPDYFHYLNQEIIQRKTDALITSIFIGGGTPTSVDSDYIVNMLKTIKKHYKVSKKAEITIECNPASTTREKLEAYQKAGIHRISFGVQSLSEEKLKLLGRMQTKQQVFEAIQQAKEVGFDNISVDLLLGLENQTSKEVIADAKTLIDMGITHISAYMLILEEETPLWALVQSGKVVLPTDDESVDIYEDLYQYLKSQGFERYEISNFAKNGKLSTHNLGYWQMKEYLGFGVSAHSYINKKRIANSKNVIDYFNKSNIITESITKARFREEAIMLGLRTKFGVNKEIVGKKRIVKQLIKDNFLQKQGENLVICEDKFGLTNQIILKLI